MKVVKEDAEKVRTMTIQMGILDRNHRVFRDGPHIFIPVLHDPEGDWPIVDLDLPEEHKPETDFHRIVQVPENLRDTLPSSFDVIGDVAIVRIPKALTPYQESIGEAMRKANPRLRLVLADEGVKGECRIRELHAIAGEGSSESLHTEFGVRMLIDPRKVYFNPRLSNERHRIAMQVKEGEVVLDMFAGAGPFPLVIWRNSNPSAIYAVDINPAAIEAMQRNIELNKADGIVPVLGDVNQVVPGLPLADRVIMNLPQSALEFLPLAISRCNADATIHLYVISERESWPGAKEKALSSGRPLGREIRMLEEKELKTYSPRMSVYSLDLRVL
ncbi:MAG: class I SAM-dependent methyltransferase family protein [Candidatus Methanomethylophilaceae archaeon]